jgi:hypothetical protein
MARVKQLSSEAIGKLTRRIGNLMARHDEGVPPHASLELAESFEIFLLAAADIVKAARQGLAKVIRRTGNWHHQIGAGGTPMAFARSTEPSRKQTDWSVSSVFVSELASKIEEAVKRIDAERPDEKTVVRFVDLPAYHTHFFLIESPIKAKGRPKKNRGKKEKACQREAFVIASPFSAPGPEQGRFYGEDQFLKSLRAVGSIRGIEHRAPDRASRSKSQSLEVER